MKKEYEQMFPDGYFITKRGEKADPAKYNTNHIVDLTLLGKWLIAWHSQRPTMAYSENRVFDVYFNQLFQHECKHGHTMLLQIIGTTDCTVRPFGGN